MDPDLRRTLALHEIAEADHRILDPFTDEHLRELARVARVGPGTRVLDLACGKGEMLCRWAREQGASGVGVDISEVFLPAARRRAEELGVTDRVRFVLADAASYRAEPASFHVGACLGATWIGGGVGGTIDLLRPAVRDDGLLLIGEPYRREPPPTEAPGTDPSTAVPGTDPSTEVPGTDPSTAVPGTDPGFADLVGLLDVFEAAGCDLVEMVLADEHSWDRYEAAQWWALRRWLDTHPGDPFAADVRAFCDDRRRAYLSARRQGLGWGVFVLRPTR